MSIPNLKLRMELMVLIILSFYRSAYSWSFVYYKQSLTWDNVKTYCETQGMSPAIVNTQQKWDQVVANITSNGRYFATYDVYIGLQYNVASGVHVWVDGTAVNWTLWFTNEPYNVGTRQCVRLAADVELHFRTTDCTYPNYFVCSKDDIITTTTTVATETDVNGDVKSEQVSTDSLDKDMVIGLSAGFSIFIVILAICCLMCYCCTSSDKDKQSILPVSRRQSRGKYSKTDDVNYRASSSYSMSSDGGYDEPNFVHIEPILDKVYYKRKRNYDSDSMNDSSTSSIEKTKQHDMMHYI